MSREHDVPELRESQPNASGPDAAAGGMGVSSERTGPTGPGQHGTDGTRDTSPKELGDDVPPEQAPGQVEENAEGLPQGGLSEARPALPLLAPGPRRGPTRRRARGTCRSLHQRRRRGEAGAVRAAAPGRAGARRSGSRRQQQRVGRPLAVGHVVDVRRVDAHQRGALRHEPVGAGPGEVRRVDDVVRRPEPPASPVCSSTALPRTSWASSVSTSIARTSEPATRTTTVLEIRELLQRHPGQVVAPANRWSGASTYVPVLATIEIRPISKVVPSAYVAVDASRVRCNEISGPGSPGTSPCPRGSGGSARRACACRPGSAARRCPRVHRAFPCAAPRRPLQRATGPPRRPSAGPAT